MLFITELFKFMDFSLLIQIKLITSVMYLVTNYITHKIKLPVTPANMLRFLISTFDFIILLILLWRYIYELGVMAIAYSFVGILFCIVVCANCWLLLELDKDVRSVFIISLLSLIIILILYIEYIFISLAYKGPTSALLTFNIIYMAGWLMLDRYPIAITNFMERIGEKLSWIDPLIGDMSHEDIVLRNVCSFHLGLLNFTYIHVSGGAVNTIILVLIGLGLLTNVLIGLRLIKASASIELHNGFMIQIVKYGFNNVATIYGQLKNKQLPKATWYAWAIALMMGVTLTSPAYASHENYASTDGRSTTGVSFTVSGSGTQPSGSGEGEAVPEGAAGSRSAEAARRYGRDVTVGIMAGATVNEAQKVYTAITNAEAGPST
uniref:hypothetical protein n=1 Tax=Ulva meridionalis TaxID=434723 RepID=UPI00211507D6|nr:hypothetical protein NQY40_mgp32 [Ulva meridionalis]UTA96524.1 hypothetical protein [Ulva meridionalis]UTA96582.1 hypothetical protein [Ulva meridionalis]UTA96635.1 hypothetical protein [Ulva meridionalis]UTA96687.1 hypothetical protein [Ulva meridionalis]UTA96750.1 hypothetical protein [Ulva meridionalis]